MKLKKTFFDIHCHAMTFQHPNFLAYINNLSRNIGDNIISDLFSPNYVMDRADKNKLKKIKNMIGVFENDISALFKLMEDDLKGRYSENSEIPPYIHSGAFHFRGSAYDRLVFCPLIMDFQSQNAVYSDIYYKRAPRKSMKKAIDNIFDGINDFYRKNPETIIRIYPFLGVNTANYSLSELEEFLKKYLTVNFKNRFLKDDVVNFSAKMNLNIKPIENLAFSGIKLYPPLGFDPWPDNDFQQLEKVKFLYEYCIKHNFPITVHCDDQGFRTIPLKESRLYTSPVRWEKVLINYPELKVNFAHFGMQYFRKHGYKKQTDWFHKILFYMENYPNVYADISFNLTVASYLDDFYKAANALPEDKIRKLEKKVLFGTDFPVNLSKIESYNEYYRRFEACRFSDKQINLFASENPSRFIF